MSIIEIETLISRFHAFNTLSDEDKIIYIELNKLLTLEKIITQLEKIATRIS